MKAKEFTSVVQSLSLGILLASCSLFSTTLNAEVKAVKLGHSFSDAHPRAIAMKKFAADVESATDGEIKITVYGNAVLGSEQQMLQATRSNVQQLYMGAVSPLAGFQKQFQIFDFPFLFSSNEEAAKILDSEFGDKLLTDLDSINLKGLTWAGGAFRNVANIKREVTTLEGFKGLKIRVMPTQVAIDSFKSLGINPSPMAYSEVFTALETGALDGHEHPSVDILQNKMYEVEKYMTLTGHVYTPVALIVSKKWFDSLTEKQKEVLQKVANGNKIFQRQQEIEQEKGAIDELRKNGMIVSSLKEGELSKIQQAVQPVIEKYKKTVGEDTVKHFYDVKKKLAE